MNTPSSIRFALVVGLLVAVSPAGCDPAPPEPTTTRDLRVRPADPEAPTIPLAVETLETQADFDALEDRLGGRMSLDTLVAVLAQLADDADPAARPEDALLLQRLAILQLRAREGSSRLREAFEVADELRRAAPDNPHGLYLLAHVASLVLQPAADGSYELDAGRRDVAVRLGEHWTRLLEVDPDYVGPNGLGAEDIRADLEALNAALEAQEVERSAPGAPPAGRGADPAVSEARRVLLDFAAANRGNRATLCRDWLEAVDGQDLPTRAERWLAVRCAVEIDLPAVRARGLDALLGLIGDGVLADPCAWIGRLGPLTADDEARVEGALRARGLDPCPAP